MFKGLILTVALLFIAGSCFAQVAGNTSDPKIPYGNGIANLKDSGMGPIKVAFDADWVFDRKLEDSSGVSSAELEGQKYLFRIGYTIADRVEPYVKIGTSHLKSSWTQSGSAIKTRAEDGIGLGFGGKVLAFEIPEHKLRFSLDGQYFYTDPGIKSARIGDNSDRSVSAAEFKVSEWQISGILSMEFIIGGDRDNPATPYSIIPYVGGAYSDSKTKVQFQTSGTDYNIGDAESKNKFLLITGCDITSPENISINVEGRWIGETAASGGCTVKF